ncbi:MAG: hypothetical protein ACKVHO_10155 [Verrucomicrobiia bacterium]
MTGVQLCSGKRIEGKDDAGVLLNLSSAGDQPLAGAADQQGHGGMGADDFKNLRGNLEVGRRDEDQPRVTGCSNRSRS